MDSVVRLMYKIMARILFVCLGNICRSPAAAGMLRHLQERDHSDLEIEVDSNGLGDWHVGALPDPRMRKAAQDRGIILATRAKQFKESDFDAYDIILAADRAVLSKLNEYATSIQQKNKLRLMTAFSSCNKDLDVPDPYLGEEADFELVLDMLEEACTEVLNHLRKSQ